MIKITIITVVYNGVKTIKRAINSVLEQTYTNIEYIVIDGNSVDGTTNIIKQYHQKINLFISEPDEGYYHGLNKGIKFASGDIIGILNADDYFRDDFVVEKVVKYFEKEKKTIVTNTRMIDKNKFSIFIATYKTKLYFQIPFMHTSAFIPREVYNKLGSYNLKYKVAADVEFLLRFFIEENKYYIISEDLVYMSVGGMSDVNFLAARQEYRDIYFKLFRNFYKSWKGFLLSIFFYYVSKLKHTLK